MRATIALLAAAIPCVLVCCAPTDVVVGDATGLKDGGDAGDVDAAEPTGDPCMSNDDCSPSSYCARRDCGEMHGHCRVRPVVCDDALAPVCGCDGVTYWNECLREFTGATASASGGDCGQLGLPSAMCDSFQTPPQQDGGAAQPPKNTCPIADAYCARLSFDKGTCSGGPMHPVDGHCWVLPPKCPADDGRKWLACMFGPPCVSTCDAIRSQEAYFPKLEDVCP
jgi:hypothetical protein